MLALDIAPIVKLILFFVFADLTALVAAVIGPTYDNLLVPELSVGSLYPPVTASHPTPGNFLAPAAHFSSYLVTHVADPLIALVALGVSLLYLARPFVARWGVLFEGLLPRLILSVVASNFVVPIASAILGVAGSLYPVVAGWDGGAWTHWANLGGFAEVKLSWDNGVLAFVLSLVEFILVFGLLLAIGVRDALLAVLIVLLPVFTLLWPFRPLSSIPRRAWLLFGELAFLPVVLVVPLELAVGSPTPVMLVSYLGVALSSPFLLSVAGAQLTAIGFPSAGSLTQSSTQRGLGSAPGAASRAAAPAQSALRSTNAAGRAAAGAIQAAGSASTPLAAPLAVRELLGHGGLRLARHLASWKRRGRGPPRLRPFGPGGLE